MAALVWSAGAAFDAASLDCVRDAMDCSPPAKYRLLFRYRAGTVEASLEAI